MMFVSSIARASLSWSSVTSLHELAALCGCRRRQRAGVVRLVHAEMKFKKRFPNCLLHTHPIQIRFPPFPFSVPKIILKYYDFENPNCNRVVFNSDFNWKIPDLKKKFLKSAKEREKLQTMFIMEGESDERTDDQKKVHLHFLDGKQISRYYDFSSLKFKKGKNNYFI